MTNRIEMKDYWEEKEIIIGISTSNSDLIAIGEVIDKQVIRFIHLNKNKLLKALEELGVTNG